MDADGRQPFSVVPTAPPKRKGPATPKAPVPKRLSRIIDLDELKAAGADGRVSDKALLADRIYAKGVKRSLQQAQMFPPKELTPATKLGPFALTPLVAPPPVDKSLVPRRPVAPTPSPVPPLALGALRHTAATPREEPTPQSPMSARDAFYLSHRAPPKRPLPSTSSAPPATPVANDGASDDRPTRAKLLHKSSQLQTFTESVEASLLSGGVPADSFLYLVSVEDNPYKLVVVGHDAIDPTNYCTMSRAGITHCRDGVPEFTHLETFEREHYMYSLVRQIPFFLKYRKWKQFRTWKTNVRACKTLLCKHVLQHDLFILRPSLHDALMTLRQQCYEMGQLRIFAVDARRTSTLGEFSEKQQAQMVATDARIDTFVAAIVETTRATCNAFLREFLVSNGFTTAEQIPADVSAVLAHLTQAPESDDDDDDDDGPVARRPVAKATWANGRVVTFTERAAMRTQCRRVTKFVRLVEFFVVDAYLLLGIASTEYLLGEMHTIVNRVLAEAVAKPAPKPKLLILNAPPPAVPLFRVEVHLHLTTLHDQSIRSQLLFDPSCDELRAEMEGVVAAGLKAATSRPRLMADTVFKPYVQPTLDEISGGELSAGLNLDMMVMEDASFQDMLGRISLVVTKAYDGLSHFTKGLAIFQSQYIANLAFMKVAADVDHPANLARSIDDLRDQLETYEAQIAQFDTLADTAVVGLLLADCRALNATLKPSPRACMACLHQLIPRIAQVKNEELMLEVSRANDAISAVPTTVDEFAAALGALRDTQANMAALDDRYMFLKQLYGLTDEFKIAVSDIDSTNAFMLAQKRAQLKTSMDLLDSSTDAYTDKFAKELDKKIPKLLAAIQERYTDLHDARLEAVTSDASDMLPLLQTIDDKLRDLEAIGVKYIGFQKALGLPQSSFDDLEVLRADVEVKKLAWTTVQSWATAADVWRDTLLTSVGVAEMEEAVAAYFKTAVTCERGLPANAVVRQLKEAVEAFKDALPIVADLRCAHLKERHWRAIGDVLRFDVHADPTLTLGRFVDMHLHEWAPAVNRIATEATQEALLEAMLQRIAGVWADIAFEVKSHNDRKDVYVLGSTEEVSSALEESLITLNTILASRFVEPVRDDALLLHKRLVLFQETLDEWLTCQREWIYLESIFSAPDIQRQLPQEAQAFATINTFWKELMLRAHDTPLCMKATAQPGLCETLLKHNASLDKMRKSLEDYLETKRQAFPRFYFLSNDELLEILAHTKEPHAVQPHLCKLFDGILRLEFGDAHGSVDILSMHSSEGERVPFGRNLKARGNVEDWLSAVQSNMKQSLHRAMKACVGDYDHGQRDSWIFHHPAQCVASVTYMVWARECEAALPVTGGLERWLKLELAQLAALTRLIRSPLTKLQRCVVTSLVTTDVHARDIVAELIALRVTTTADFNWKKQLRYGWSVDVDDVTIEQSNVHIRYGYEYMGATSRLVITPLTDRCWMTITGAYDLRLGASPSGPAGTGKTETSKDLAKALAIQCIVFNCSDQIDYKTMAKLFCGLAQSGCWTCLDEFNRIDIEVLSVIAQQLMLLRRGRLAGATDLAFEGRTIALKDHHVIVTMNPGYAGRTELPDNLKICFRPVSMMVPDYALIAEIMMFSEGFDNAKDLSQKITKLYKLCSEQLSQQAHYDFGMRAVKTVLVMAGGLKRAPGAATASEEVVLIRALRDANTPKFVEDDLRLFHAILRDLFPSIHVPETASTALEEAVVAATKADGLQEVPAFTRKTLELFETLQVRVGIALTGCSGSGKTACYAVLRRAMGDLRDVKASPDKRFQRVAVTVLNPKSISLGELYGSFHPLTREWKDGLASALMRAIITDTTAKADKEGLAWLLFDGPIDALWIENLNTVLDDNMTLCLASGERIRLLPKMRLIFEVSDLQSASPASVSRLGVLYFSATTLGWRPFVESWLTETFGTDIEPRYSTLKLRSRVSKALELLLESPASPASVHRSLPHVMPTTHLSCVANACDLIALLLNKQRWFAAAAAEKQLKCVDLLVVFGVTWAFGANLSDANAAKFNEQLLAVLAEHRSQFHSSLLQVCGKSSGGPLSCTGSGASRTVATVFDFNIDFAELAWSHWDNEVAPFTYQMYTPIFNLIVPTVDVTKASFLLTLLVGGMKPVMLTGDTGGGKTVVAHAVLDGLAARGDDAGVGVIPLYIHFSAQTSSGVTQATIEGKLTKKRKTLLGAPVNKKVVVFVDDINLPVADAYGTQPCLELLRQLLDHKGLYDRDKYFWKDIADTVVTAAGAPPGGGRQPMPPRLLKHFTIICLPAGHEGAMRAIFHAIMSGHVASFAFAPALRDTLLATVEATIKLYAAVCDALRPTPAKCHYLFNLRDVSKVFAGLLHSRPALSVDGCVKLWMHENMRVFYDRLVSAPDREWFTTALISLVNKHFRMGWTHDHIFGAEDTIPVLFGCYGAGSPKGYEEIVDMESLETLLSTYVADYNTFRTPHLQLIFFRDTILHVSSIARVLMQPRGNLMLVGVGGSGKRSLARLAASMMEMACVEIQVARTYGRVEFRDDLKKLLVATGVKGKETMFLLTDAQIVCEEFVEDVNSLLNAGEIPHLFTHEEYEAVLSDMKGAVADAGLDDTRTHAEGLFVHRVRTHLHLVLCLSPVGTAFRRRCRQFPSLINCTTIDWYEAWPASALVVVAESYLGDVTLADESLRRGLVQMFVRVHESIAEYGALFLAAFQRHVYITPKSYLDAIHLYVRMLAEKRWLAQEAYDRLSTGVVKLEDTNVLVAGLKVELTNLQPVLAAKAIEAEELLKQVAIDQAEAKLVEQRVSADEAVVKAQAQDVAECQADALRDLEIAMPALNAAVQALDSLDKKDITEVKSFTKPPQAVQVVMEAVCIMLGEKPDWDTSKRVLSKPTFMQELKDYDKDNIAPKTLTRLKKYIDNPDFAVDEVKKVSRAAMSLCMWVHAMDIYAKVSKDVGPKRERLAQMNATLADANAKLNAKQTELAEVMARVHGLQTQCDAVVAEKKRLAAEAELTHARLSRAEKLTTGLADELVRWKASLEVMAADEVNLVGDVFLAAAAIAYLGPFDCTFRAQLQELWHGAMATAQLPTSPSASLLTTCADAATLREWQLNGLPTDVVSGENAVMLFRGERWPLLIDPQQQARSWLLKMEAPFGLQVAKVTDKTLLQAVETGVRDGQPLVLDDVGETLDPALDPLLLKALTKQGGACKAVLRVGDRDVLYDRNFRLYLVTKLPNPHYLPDVSIKVNLINFTVTKEGLQDQLLGDVVRKEQPEIEAKMSTLLASIATDQKLLKAIESKILSLLSTSQGNILDDQVLISTLGESKKTSMVVSERLTESEVTKAAISDIRNKYTAVAVRGSILYFVLADLAAIDPMYQYSLEYFKRLFNQSLADTEASSCNLALRLAALVDAQTFVVYKNVCRGLFEAHKLLFSFMMAVRILIDAGAVTTKELSLLHVAPPVATDEGADANALPPKAHQAIVAVSAAIPALESLPDSVVLFPDSWRRWYSADEPYRTPLPDGYDAKVTPFQRLVLVKAVRPDKAVPSASDFIAACLGPTLTTPPPFFMGDVYPDLDKGVPCVFILSSGADPTSILHRFAQELGRDDRLHLVSLGQGQGPVASALIRQCAASGDWVLLQNCHLAKSWMPQLELLLTQLRADTADVHDDFRLFLTSFPAPYFPVAVLQSSVKVTNEPPKGLKPNLRRSYEMLISDTVLDQCVQPVPWRKLVFGLCFFHAVVQERAKFGPMGWTKLYQFNDSDLETAIAVLQTFLDTQEIIPWDALHYVTGEINYGGRVTDEFDRRCLLATLCRFYDATTLTAPFTPAAPQYLAPACTTVAEFHAFIDQLPSADVPAIFGLHDNANVVYETHEGAVLFGLVRGLQARGTDVRSAAADDDDNTVLAVASQVQAALPPLLDRATAVTGLFDARDGQLDSLATVLGQELVKYNVLLTTVAGSVAGLQLAVQGLAVMSETLDATYKSLVLRQVPEEWAKVGFASLKPLAGWLADLVHRVAFMADWLARGKPDAFPLPVFFFPQGFLTGVLQTHARKYALPINTLEFAFEVDPAADGDGAVVTGMFLEGGQWIDGRLVDASPNVMFAVMPPIRFLPRLPPTDAAVGYECPVYKTTARRGTLSTTGISTNFVVTVLLPCAEVPTHWMLQGTALICNLDD
ncbi:dynein heavy chain [Achlya hypogyna]|uniref:Dynein heavy chain n=1 Tax=Achlya hypogyna TaxID=1202772 RepID=A0A1V9YP36_ACHHY|nr:dynein heavy chain [Achlya hypogyna]